MTTALLTVRRICAAELGVGPQHAGAAVGVGSDRRGSSEVIPPETPDFGEPPGNFRGTVAPRFCAVFVGGEITGSASGSISFEVTFRSLSLRPGNSLSVPRTAGGSPSSTRISRTARPIARIASRGASIDIPRRASSRFPRRRRSAIRCCSCAASMAGPSAPPRRASPASSPPKIGHSLADTLVG